MLALALVLVLCGIGGSPSVIKGHPIIFGPGHRSGAHTHADCHGAAIVVQLTVQRIDAHRGFVRLYVTNAGDADQTPAANPPVILQLQPHGMSEAFSFSALPLMKMVRLTEQTYDPEIFHHANAAWNIARDDVSKYSPCGGRFRDNKQLS